MPPPFIFGTASLEADAMTDAAAPILLFDSGVGGLSVLAELRAFLRG